ncbi:MAG: PQQ-binding-like beta-propeller repeat protein [Actinomycetota bacterium]
MIAAALVLLLGGVVVVRSVVGGGVGNERADGPRLPAAIDERWSVDLADVVVVDAVVTASSVVVVTDRRGPGGVDVVAYDTADGSERWTRPLDSVSTDLTVVDDDIVVVSATREFAEGRFSFGVDPTTGDERWERTGDGVVLASAQMLPLGLVDSGRFPATEPSLEIADLRTGETVPPLGGRLAGLRADGGVIVLDDDGAVRVVDLGAFDPASPDAELPSETVATTSRDRRNVVGLAGRWFASTDDGLVEVGFAADEGRVLIDARSEDERGVPIPTIESSSFFAPVDDRRAVMLGTDGAFGVELAGDELRVTWSAQAVVGLPHAVDGDRVVVEAVGGGEGRDGFGPVELRDAATGEVLAEYDGLPGARFDRPVDGVVAWDDTGTASDPERFDGTVVALDLDGGERWRVDDVAGLPAIGDSIVALPVTDGTTRQLVLLDEGPRTRE